jgi:hypothetical protein
MPVHVVPYLSEGLESLLFRVAERNGLQSASDIIRAAGSRYQDFDAYDLDSLCAALNLSRVVLRSTVPIHSGYSVSFGVHSLDYSHIAMRESRICPICVSEFGYGRAEWYLRVLPVCWRHGIYLTDGCPCKPEVPLKHCRKRYAQCDCGEFLGSRPVQRASDAARLLAEDIHALFHPLRHGNIERKLHGFKNLPMHTSLGDLLNMISILGSLDTSSGLFLSNRSKSLTVRLSYYIDNFERAANLLTNSIDHVASIICFSIGMDLSTALEKETNASPYLRYLSSEAPSMFDWLFNARTSAI